MRRSLVSLSCVLLGLLACHSARRDPFAGVGPLVGADAIVEGRVQASATDTVDAKLTIRLLRARWALRTDRDESRDFWSDIALLDTQNAERAARTMDERTFAVALRTLMDGQSGAAAVAFGLLHAAAPTRLCAHRPDDGALVRLRIGGNVAVARQSRADRSRGHSPCGRSRAVWARALSMTDARVRSRPACRCRCQPLGTPVITIKINGKSHEFWLTRGEHDAALHRRRHAAGASSPPTIRRSAWSAGISRRARSTSIRWPSAP